MYEGSNSGIQGWKDCIIYYVDHYNDTVSVDLKDWDNRYVDYTSETTANVVSTAIDGLIDTWAEKTRPTYLLIVGDDDIIPFYRRDDPRNREHQWKTGIDPYGGNPRVKAQYHDFYYTDNPYADYWGYDYKPEPWNYKKKGMKI